MVIQCGYLNQELETMVEEVIFLWIRNYFIVNQIQTDIESFMQIEYKQTEQIEYQEIQDKSEGYIIPIGGGKDSVVTLETLKEAKDDYCLIINPKPVTIECAKIAGIDDEHIIEIHRTIDKNLIKLNSQGFINGHTPFSTMLAFVSYFIAYLTSKSIFSFIQ